MRIRAMLTSVIARPTPLPMMLDETHAQLILHFNESGLRGDLFSLPLARS